MAEAGLAKLRLVMEIDGDKAVVVGLDKVDAAVDHTSRTSKTATERMATGMGNVEAAAGRMAASTVTATQRASQQTGMFGETITTVTQRAAKSHAELLTGIKASSAGVSTATERMAGGMHNVEAATGRMASGMVAADGATGMLTGSLGGLHGMVKKVIGAWMSWEILQKGKDVVMFAANMEMAERALNVVGNATGRTYAEMAKYRDGLKEINITSAAATNTIAMMSRAELDLDKAIPLARLAQGSARMASLSGETLSSSDALNRLIHGIITMQPEVLKTMGITTTLESAMRKYKQRTGESAETLSEHQRVQLLFNSVLENGQPLMELYVNTLDLASSKISSSQRPIEELKLALGQLFLPELTVAASAFYDTVSGGMKWVRGNQAELEGYKRTVWELTDTLKTGAEFMALYFLAFGGYTLVTNAGAALSLFNLITTSLTTAISLNGAAAVTTATQIGMMGEATTVATTASTIGVFTLKGAFASLFAFIAGYQIGKLLYNEFETVRNIGTHVVWGLMRGWGEFVFVLKEAKTVLANMFDVTAMNEQMEKIDRERNKWREEWSRSKAEQLNDNQHAPVSTMPTVKPPQDNATAIAESKDRKEKERKEELARQREAAQAAAFEAQREADAYTQLLRQAQEQYFAYSKAFDDRVLAGIRNSTTLLMAELDARHSQGLISEQNYLDSRLALEKIGLNQELAQLNDRFEQIKRARDEAALANAKPVGYDSKGTPLYNAELLATEMRTEIDYQNILKDREGILAKIAQAEQKHTLDKDANLLKELKDQLSAEISLQQALGRTSDATEKQIELDKLSRGKLDEKTQALLDQLDALKRVTAAQAEANAIAQVRGYVEDINISMMNDPYEQQRAAMIRRYEEEKRLKEEQLALSKQGSELEKAQLAELAAMQLKLNKDLADNRAEQSQHAWSEVLKHATKAVPQLAAFDKLIEASQKNYIVKGKDGVIDQTRSNLSMYGAYTSAATDMFQSLASTQDTTSRQGFETAKAFNTAAAIMSTAAAIMNAMANVPYPMNIAVAALAGITGAIQIAKIQSTTFGGGAGSVSAPSGSFAGAGGASSGSGLGNISAPLMSVRDSQTEASLTRLTASTDNVAVAIGRLSKSMDDLTALFKEGGAGYTLATNAPNQNAAIGNFGNAVPLAGGDGFWSTTGKSAAIGATIGSIAGPLGAIAGGVIGSIVGSTLNAFFGTGNKWQPNGGGITVEVVDGAIEGGTYTKQKKKGGWFTSDKNRTLYSDNEEITSYLGSMVQPYVNDINRMAMTLGTTANISSYSAARTNIATAGRKPEDIAKDLEKWTTTTLQGMAMTVDGLKDVVGSYDDAYAKLREYNDALVSTNEAFGLIGKTQLQGSLKTAEFLSAVQRDLFGGMEGFNDAVNTYFENMYSDQEQATAKAAQAQRQVTAEFREMGLAVPATKEQFRALVNSLDVTTVSGAQTFAALMSVSESFGAMIDYAEEMKKAQRELDQDVTSRMLRATDREGLADLYDLQKAQEKELADAREKGLSVTELLKVQALEYAEAAKKAAETISKAQQTLIDNSKKALSEAISGARSILSTLKGILTTTDNPATSYTQALALFRSADASNISERATALITASKNNASTRDEYEADRQMAINALAAYAETTPTVSAVERQIDLLSQISKAISDGNISQLTALTGVQSLITSATQSATGDTLGLRDTITASSVAQLLKLQDAVTSIYGTSGSQVSTLQGLINTVQGGTSDQLAQLQSVIGSVYGTTQAVNANKATSDQIKNYSTSQDAALSGINASTASMASLLAAYLAANEQARAEAAAGAASVQRIAAATATYNTARDSYETKRAELESRYISGAIDISSFRAQSAANHSNLSGSYTTAVSAGATSITPPPVISGDWATAYLTDERMRTMASTISDTALKMAVGLVPQNLQYDIAPIVNGKSQPNGVVDTGDALVWLQIANGAPKWSDLGLPAFAAGGITSGPSIAGEAGYPEAVVPLPDGRTIPVKFHARPVAADNRELIDELQGLRDEVRQLRAEQRAGDAANAQNSAKTAKLLDKWDKDGAPPQRMTA